MLDIQTKYTDMLTTFEFINLGLDIALVLSAICVLVCINLATRKALKGRRIFNAYLAGQISYGQAVARLRQAGFKHFQF